MASRSATRRPPRHDTARGELLLHTLTETTAMWSRHTVLEVRDVCAHLELGHVRGSMLGLRRIVRMLRQLLMLRRLSLVETDVFDSDPGLARDVPELRTLLAMMDHEIWPTYVELLTRLDVRASDLYATPSAAPRVVQLSERLVELDRLVRRWNSLLPAPADQPETSPTTNAISFRARLRSRLADERAAELELALAAQDPEVETVNATFPVTPPPLARATGRHRRRAPTAELQ